MIIKDDQRNFESLKTLKVPTIITPKLQPIRQANFEDVIELQHGGLMSHPSHRPSMMCTALPAYSAPGYLKIRRGKKTVVVT